MKINIVKTNDYSALYIDGKLYDEGHSIHDDIYHNLLRQLGAEVESKYIKYSIEDDFDSFPSNYNEIKEPIK